MFDVAPAWILDLTHPIRQGFGDLPGHPQTEIRPVHTHGEHKRSNAALITSIHAGTHVDSPYHFIPSGISIDMVDVLKLCGKAVLLDLSGSTGAGYGIRPDDLEKGLSSTGLAELAGWRVIIKSGWESRYGTAGYYRNNPHLTRLSAEWLARKGAALIGLDFPPDGIGDKVTVPAPAPVHQTLLGNGICIVENLANLAQVPTAVFGLLCLPLKLEGEGGAPARVLAYSLGDGDK